MNRQTSNTETLGFVLQSGARKLLGCYMPVLGDVWKDVRPIMNSELKIKT